MRREFATADGSYDGRLVVYRLEFFYIATKEKVVADEWEVEDWRYPDLTAVDCMVSDGYDFEQSDLDSGIIVTLFIEEKPVSCVVWHGYGMENIDEVFEVERDE